MKICLPPIKVDHNIIFYQSNIEMIGRNGDTYFFRRNMKFFSGEKLNRDLAFADRRPMYQEENCDEMFSKFYEIFQRIIDQHAPIHICDSSINQNKKVIKHGYPSISKNYDVFDEFKECRNLVNRKLRDAHHKYYVNFFKQCETAKQKWNFFNEKL